MKGVDVTSLLDPSVVTLFGFEMRVYKDRRLIGFLARPALLQLENQPVCTINLKSKCTIANVNWHADSPALDMRMHFRERVFSARNKLRVVVLDEYH